MFELHEILMLIAWTAGVWGMGYYAGYDKKCRDIKREEIRTAIKPSGVYLEKMWSDDYDLENGK